MNSLQKTAQNKVLDLSPEPVTALQLRYFYGTESDNTTFYMTPKLLFRNKALSTLSADAKILYILLLDRMKLSAMNGLKEKDGRLFVFYTIEEACYELHKTNNTIGKAFSELDSTKGIGLIERCKRGQGKADKIYVKSVASLPADYPTFSEKRKAEAKALLSESTESAEISAQTVTYKTQQQAIPPIPTTENYPQLPVSPPHLQENQPQFFENGEEFTANNVDNFSPIQNLHLQECNNCISRNEEIEFLETQKLHGNNTDVTNTKINENDLLKPTFLPNPHGNYAQPLSKEVLMERWGEGWEDMTKEKKLYVLDTELTQGYQDNKLEYLLYNYRTNKDTMSLVLDHLMGMEELDLINQDNSECSQKQFSYKATKLYKQALLEMLTEERHTKTKHGYISYSQVMEKVLSHLNYQEYSHSVKFDNIVECTVLEYMDAAAETTIKHKLNYMKTCIWSTFLTGNIYDEQRFHKFATDMNLNGYERDGHVNMMNG